MMAANGVNSSHANFKRTALFCLTVFVASLCFSSFVTVADEPVRSPADEQPSAGKNVHLHVHSHGGHRHGHDHAHPHGNPAADDSLTSPPLQESRTRLLRVLAMYGLAIAAASLLGGWLPGKIRLNHLGFQCLLSLVGGVLLGIGLLHLLPHAIHELGSSRVDYVLNWMLGGILAMFFLLRTLHVHHHEPPALDTDPETTTADNNEHEVQHAVCSHGHGHHGHEESARLGWAGMFFGLSLHTLLDGLALGAAMQADLHHQPQGWLGLGILIGIVLHKPLDSFSFTTLMIQAGQSKRRQVLINLCYSLLCPLGAMLFLLGAWNAGGQTSVIVGAGLAFSAGVFLCIALADLLPEMEFHSHNRWRLSLFLVTGIALAWAIRFLEPAHLH